MPAIQPNPGDKFIDTDTALSAAQIVAIKDAGYSGIARYLSRETPQRPGDLSATEAATILAAGLWVVPVQHVAPGGWVPSADLGTSLGRAAAENAVAIGIPSEVCLWLDLEGVAATSGENDVVAFCNGWLDEVEVNFPGYVGAVYVGANCGLEPSELYWSLKTEHYWHSGSSSAPIPAVRGVQIVQTISEQLVLDGVSFDSNIVLRDSLGNLPWVWGP